MLRSLSATSTWAICDHTPNVRVVPGLDAEALRRQGPEIAAANDGLAPFRDPPWNRGGHSQRRWGSISRTTSWTDLDWVQLSLHAGQRDEPKRLTDKVTQAMRHPSVRCLSHPTGRIIHHRAPNALDLERVIEVALKIGVALEVNGLPNRLDLSAEHVRLALQGRCPDRGLDRRPLDPRVAQHAACGRHRQYGVGLLPPTS